MDDLQRLHRFPVPRRALRSHPVQRALRVVAKRKARHRRRGKPARKERVQETCSNGNRDKESTAQKLRRVAVPVSPPSCDGKVDAAASMAVSTLWSGVTTITPALNLSGGNTSGAAANAAGVSNSCEQLEVRGRCGE